MKNLCNSSCFQLGVFLLLMISTSAVNAQSRMVAMPSPNAASLGTFGQIPVSHYAGMPQVSIPLYEISNGDLSVPVSLKYHAAMVRPESFPGWVGLGWNLSCGGSITRISKGSNLYDENITTFSDFPSYLRAYTLLDTYDWSTTTRVNELTSPTHNAIGYPTDFEPDEFTFNFGNYSGSFFLNHKGQWKVQSTSPVQLKIVSHLQGANTFLFNGFYNIGEFYSGFSVFTEDGTENNADVFVYSSSLHQAP